jgi:hypothetical protein
MDEKKEERDDKDYEDICEGEHRDEDGGSIAWMGG